MHNSSYIANVKIGFNYLTVILTRYSLTNLLPLTCFEIYILKQSLPTEILGAYFCLALLTDERLL